MELVLVIALIAVVASLSADSFGSLVGWKQKGELRKFVDTWEFLGNEAAVKQEAYRLVVNLDLNRYYVRREVQSNRSVEQVDHLANLRTKGEREKRAQEGEEEELLSLEEEFKEEDVRQGGTLEELFYNFVFYDPNGPKRLAMPTSFPSLAEGKVFSDGLKIRDVETALGKITQGKASLRISPRSGGELSLVHMVLDEQVLTLVMNPVSGKVQTYYEDVDYKKVFSEYESYTK